MSRKPKPILWRERLEKISECPGEIFDKLEPQEQTFRMIESAESGNTTAIRDTVKALLDAYENDECINPAITYFINLGLCQGDCVCARALLKCIDIFNQPLELIDRAAEVLKDCKTQDDDLLIKVAMAKRIMFSALESSEYVKAADALLETDCEFGYYARIFLESKRLAEGGEFNRDAVGAVASKIGAPNIVFLPFLDPSASCDKAIAQSDAEKELTKISKALGLMRMDDWRDFWLKATYEYAEAFLNGDISAVADEMAAAIEERYDYRDKKLHLLALKKFKMDKADISDDPEYDKLYAECRFDGHVFDVDSDEALGMIIKEAVYSSSRKLRADAVNAARFGTFIEHTKNRFFFSAEMKNHIKRAFKHIWEITISFETESDTPPEFGKLRIDERRYTAKRNGTELPKEKKLSQVFCSGVISINDKTYPIETDLLLDIVYVSTTKCEFCDIQVREFRRDGNYLIMKCCLIIY